MFSTQNGSNSNTFKKFYEIYVSLLSAKATEKKAINLMIFDDLNFF